MISLLDNDLYKLTMMQAVFHQFPNVLVKYEFKCRNKGIDFSNCLEKIRLNIDFVRQTTFNIDEVLYLKSLNLFQQDFLDYLLFNYKNNLNQVKTFIENDELKIEISGSWLNTILLEVPILSAINESYFEPNNNEETLNIGKKLLKEKIVLLKDYNIDLLYRNMEYLGTPKIIEFGTRRRFSFEWQKYVIEQLKNSVPNNLIGTSNLLFAKMFNLKPFGTFAHEWPMAHQALYRVEESQKYAIQNWANEYRGKLGIALSDTLGIKKFLQDFDLYFSKLYDGIRQDSGDPFTIYEKMVNHYNNFGIDPKTKTIVFSDGLTVAGAIELYKITDKMNVLFGIGTHLTNDLGLIPLQIVIKMIECNGQPIAKISEARGKTMCKNQTYLDYLKQVCNID